MTLPLAACKEAARSIQRRFQGADRDGFWKSNGDRHREARAAEMISAARGTLILSTAILVGLICRSTQASDTPRYCLTIAIDLHASLREEVSAIDLIIENAFVVSIPKFPEGWGIKVQNYVDNTPTKISGGATGNVAELRAKDLTCLFEIEKNVPGEPRISVAGSVIISNGKTELRLMLDKRQFVLRKIRPE